MDIWSAILLVFGTAGLAELVARSPLFEGVRSVAKSEKLRCGQCVGFVLGVLVYLLYSWSWLDPVVWFTAFPFGGLVSITAIVTDKVVGYLAVSTEYKVTKMTLETREEMKKGGKGNG